MAWDRRGYFYRSRRSGGKVVRDYFGRGPLAEVAAGLAAEIRNAALADREASARLTESTDRSRELFEALRAAVATHMRAAGFHRHDRGAWRKQRGDRSTGL